MYPRDWAQGGYKYELFPPFLHHYKSCFHLVPRQMDLGSKGQKEPPVSRNCGKSMDVAVLQHGGEPSPQELGKHPWQPDSVQPLWKEA